MQGSGFLQLVTCHSFLLLQFLKLGFEKISYFSCENEGPRHRNCYHLQVRWEPGSIFLSNSFKSHHKNKHWHGEHSPTSFLGITFWAILGDDCKPE